jgi:hypothetical protein
MRRRQAAGASPARYCRVDKAQPLNARPLACRQTRALARKPCEHCSTGIVPRTAPAPPLRADTSSYASIAMSKDIRVSDCSDGTLSYGKVVASLKKIPIFTGSGPVGGLLWGIAWSPNPMSTSPPMSPAGTRTGSFGVRQELRWRGRQQANCQDLPSRFHSSRLSAVR